MTFEEYENLPELLKVRQVAALLNIAPDTVLNMIRNGRIHSEEVFQPNPNGHKRIRKSAVWRILKFNVNRPFPGQKVFILTGRLAENALNYEIEDAQAGIRYAPYKIQ